MPCRRIQSSWPPGLHQARALHLHVRCHSALSSAQATGTCSTESQRDSISQPRVVRQRYPEFLGNQESTTLKVVEQMLPCSISRKSCEPTFCPMTAAWRQPWPLDLL